MLHSMKRYVRLPGVPRRHAFTVVGLFINPFAVYAPNFPFWMLASKMQYCFAMNDSRDIRPGDGKGGDAMNVERWIRVIAGTFVLVSLGLGWYVSPWFLLFTAFVGLNLFQSGWTNWCLMEKILIKSGVPKR
jgi:hypothetical protein